MSVCLIRLTNWCRAARDPLQPVSNLMILANFSPATNRFNVTYRCTSNSWNPCVLHRAACRCRKLGSSVSAVERSGLTGVVRHRWLGLFSLYSVFYTYQLLRCFSFPFSLLCENSRVSIGLPSRLAELAKIRPPKKSVRCRFGVKNNERSDYCRDCEWFS